MNQRTTLWIAVSALALAVVPFGSAAAANVVGGTSVGHYSTVQAAIDALPASGGEVDVTPGKYKEQVTIDKPNVRLIGEGSTAGSTIILDDRWAQMIGSNGSQVGDEGASTVIVTNNATDFYMENLEVENLYTQEGHTQTQAPAIFVSADRVVMRNVRLVGRQDTAYFGSAGCTNTYCNPARQYVYGSYIEGTVDFIFGDGATVFDNCLLRIDENGSLQGPATITAQNKLYNNYLSGYVVYGSKIISNPATGMTNAYLGRPWSPLSTVAFIDSTMQAPINVAGWMEMVPGQTDSLPTSHYAEFGSVGPGAIGYGDHEREPYATYLTSSQITSYTPDVFLSGTDHWAPTNVY
jgi:pectin methylesterase-like acyl-CoA thioesterase